MFKRLFLFILPILFLSPANKGYAQTTKHSQLIQFSGVVVDRDSAQKIPFVAIIIKKSGGGTIADYFGFFSFIAIPGDTILFSAIGYKTNFYVIPDTLTTDKYSWIHIMTKDTSSLKPFVYYSWPSKEAFRAAFLKLDIANNDLDRARNNMAIAARHARYGEARSPELNYLQTSQQEFDKLYYVGQLPPNNLLNPIAWGQFIQAWKDGSLDIQ